MPLTTRQLEVLEIVQALQPRSVALGGGAALIDAGLVDRPTRDLDFFSNDINAIGIFADELIESLATHGHAPHVITRSQGFVQLEANQVLIDIAHNYLGYDPIQAAIGLRCADADLVGGKIEALFARRVNRDMIDVAQLLDRYTMAELVAFAKDRDAGFSVPITIEMATGNDYDPRQLFDEAEFSAAKAKVLAHLGDLVDP